MTARLLALLVLVGLLYLAQLYVDYMILRLLLLVLVLLLLSCWLYLLVGRRFLVITQRLLYPMQERGQAACLELHITNRQPGAFGQLNLHVILPGGTVTPRKELHGLTVWPGDSQTLRLDYTCQHCGRFPVGLRSIIVTDLFGLFRMNLHRPASLQQQLSQQLILPRLSAPATDLQPGLLLAEQIDQASPRYSPEVDAIADLRPLQPGDSAKRIHWKVSARLGELMIKEFEDPLQHEILVLVDPVLPVQSSPLRLDCLDFLAETILALLDPLLQHHHRLSLATFTPSRTMQSYDQARDLLRLQNQLCDLAAAAASQDPQLDFPEQLMLETANQAYGLVIVLTWQLRSSLVDQLIAARLRHPRLFVLILAQSTDQASPSGHTPAVSLDLLTSHDIEWQTLKIPATPPNPSPQAGNKANAAAK